MYRLNKRKIKRIMYIIILLICDVFIIFRKSENVLASDKEDSQIYQYDYSKIDEAAKSAGYGGSFEEILKQVMGEIDIDGNNAESKNENVISKVLKSFDIIIGNTIKGNKTAIVQIILLAVFSAAMNCFAPSFNKSQISETAQMIVSISLIGILLAAFMSACSICMEAVETCVTLYKSIIPVFFSVVVLSSGNTTAAVYYEVVLMMITFVNGFFGSVLVSINKIYVLFSLADCVSEKEHFTKAADIVPSVIKWICRCTIVFFTGLGGIKGMIAPVSDSMKKKVLYKAMQVIPVVGGSLETVTQTVLSAGTIIKNAIGTAAIIIIIVLCSIPVCKLIMMVCLFKVTAAVIEPIADKRLVKAVSCVSTAIGSFAVIVITSSGLFVLMSAVICISTNFTA